MNLKTNPELLPLVEWWEKDGKQTVIWLAVALIAVGGWYGWKAHRAAVQAAASDALVNAYTAEEIEDAVTKFSGQAAAGTLKLRLAKKYFDEARYEEALAQYEELDGKAPDGFADVPVVGKAMCQEALGKYAEAKDAFSAFAEKNPDSFLALTAKLGAARCQAAAGDKDGALKALAALAESVKDDVMSKARVEATEQTVKRYKATPVAAPAAVSAPAAPAAPAKAK